MHVVSLSEHVFQQVEGTLYRKTLHLHLPGKIMVSCRLSLQNPATLGFRLSLRQRFTGSFWKESGKQRTSQERNDSAVRCGHVISQGRIWGYRWSDLLPKESNDRTLDPPPPGSLLFETPGSQQFFPAFKTWKPIC